MQQSRLTIPAVLLFISSTTCFYNPDFAQSNYACDTNSDCPDGFTCNADKKCKPISTKDPCDGVSCPSGQQCVDGKCKPIAKCGEGGTYCEEGKDCVGTECLKPCTQSGTMCDATTRCENGYCHPYVATFGAVDGQVSVATTSSQIYCDNNQPDKDCIGLLVVLACTSTGLTCADVIKTCQPVDWHVQDSVDLSNNKSQSYELREIPGNTDVCIFGALYETRTMQDFTGGNMWPSPGDIVSSPLKLFVPANQKIPRDILLDKRF